MMALYEVKHTYLPEVMALQNAKWWIGKGKDRQHMEILPQNGYKAYGPV